MRAIAMFLSLVSLFTASALMWVMHLEVKAVYYMGWTILFYLIAMNQPKEEKTYSNNNLPGHRNPHKPPNKK